MATYRSTHFFNLNQFGWSFTMYWSANTDEVVTEDVKSNLTALANIMGDNVQYVGTRVQNLANKGTAQLQNFRAAFLAGADAGNSVDPHNYMILAATAGGTVYHRTISIRGIATRLYTASIGNDPKGNQGGIQFPEIPDNLIAYIQTFANSLRGSKGALAGIMATSKDANLREPILSITTSVDGCNWIITTGADYELNTRVIVGKVLGQGVKGINRPARITGKAGPIADVFTYTLTSGPRCCGIPIKPKNLGNVRQPVSDFSPFDAPPLGVAFQRFATHRTGGPFKGTAGKSKMACKC